MDEALRHRLIDAVELALGGDWQAAHLIAQEHESERLANWIHAIVHRMEGDDGNAAYWYARCGRAELERFPVETELRQVRAALA